MTEKYNAADVEPRWQKIWAEEDIFRTDDSADKPKFYALEMFPYPSGRIHMGHVRNYAMGDVVARYKKAQGFEVLHPMGWDSFGMPAENAAIATGGHPKDWTYNNIDEMRAPLQRLGFARYGSVVFQNHGLRGRLAEGFRHARPLARKGPDDASQLDWEI